ncbi:MAG: M12 family metallo-peptidase [Hyphomicrobium sp.]
MPASKTVRAFRAALLATATIAFPLAGSWAVGPDEKDTPTVGVILSKLPSKDSRAYEELATAAQRPQTEALEMTRSEMWSFPRDSLDAVKAAAVAHGVDMMLIEAGSMSAMTAMPEADMTAEQSAMMRSAMSDRAAMGVHMMALPDARVIEYALTRGMDGGANEDAATELVIPLDDRQKVTVRRTAVEATGDGYAWHGTIAGSGEMVTLLWWPSGRLTGQFDYQGHRYAIRHMGGTMHGVVEMAPRMLPPEHAPMRPAAGQTTRMKDDPLVSTGDASVVRKPIEPPEPIRNLQDASAGASPAPSTELALHVPPSASGQQRARPVTITLLVAYTPAAASHYTDIGKDLIALAVAEANQSFVNSGIGHVKLELAGAYRTDYAEEGSHFEHVFRFADKGDGFMDEVHEKRDALSADVSLLIVHDPNGCGLAAGVAPAADRAFAVVHHVCAATSYSLAHEIGHLIGARHDQGLDDSTTPFPFGHGFVHGVEWRTMMSYQESCDGCPRLPIWSNPRIKVRGVAAGTDEADNARAIAEGAERVSRFR